MNEPLLHFDEVGFSYDGARPVLCEASFQLRPGERVALVGSNGSGKTTLLHLAVGLLRPDEGRVVAFGRARESEKDFREVRAAVGLLFQEPEDQLFCPTVEEDVAFGPLNLGKSPEQARRTARRTLASLGLEGYADRVTYKLSEGEKRLVSLATVLAMEPEALLLDEPTAGLDRDIVEHLLDILNDQEVAILAVSHDTDFLGQVTERTLRLRDGRLDGCSLGDYGPGGRLN